MAVKTEPSRELIVEWRCLKCDAKGEFFHAPSEPVDIRWNRVLHAHLTADPGCHRQFGDSGIAVLADGWRPPV